MKFEIYKDVRGQYRWRLKAANGEIIAQGEAYVNKQGCKDTIDSFKRNVAAAPVADLT